jgi:hypothetical protein
MHKAIYVNGCFVAKLLLEGGVGVVGVDVAGAVRYTD